MSATPSLQAGSARVPAPTFRLTRYFQVLGLLGIVVVTLALVAVYRHLTLQHLLEHGSQANVDLTRAFVNHTWHDHRELVTGSAGRGRDELLADPRQAPLRADTLQLMHGLQAVRFKLYNLKGTTVFSTDARQVGEDKSANTGYLAARDGQVVSDITHRDQFDTAEGTLSHRDLIYSYVPVRGANGVVEAVAEIYSDVTPLLQRQQRAQWQVAALVVALSGALYLFLFLIMRKAEGIIARQDAERLLQALQMRHQARHDSLTGLANRSEFPERLSEALAQATRHGRPGALMFIDLDRFKAVNDSLGHDAGDQLLKTVAERLRACLREGDALFRMGGDEFTLIATELAQPEDAALLARRVIADLSVPMTLSGHRVAVGATVGIAVFPADGTDVETLLQHADAAMYAAKEAGRGTHAFFSAQMNERARARMALAAELRQAHHEGRFVVHYQPRFDAGSGRLLAAEALLRWNRPGEGLVPAQRFIGALDDAGLLQPVGEWVLRTVCRQLRLWHEQGRPLRVSVNLSPSQFRSAALVEQVRRVLDETGAPPPALELELAEPMLLIDPVQARTTLAGLRALGVRLVLHGFGTGASVLQLLRRDCIDGVKIHPHLLDQGAPGVDPMAAAVAVVQLAHACGLHVVAENVDTEQARRTFTAARCDELQGYGFGAPVAADDLFGTTAGVEAGEPGTLVAAP
ncbi:MAG: EAL domain-containing protein [Rubrivivax sp.]|nr:EAL domain-containing protein [Rubrivivax sp.]